MDARYRLTRRQLVQGTGVAGLGLLAACGRLPGQAQAPARAPVVGWLVGPSAAAVASDLEAARQGLRDLGWQAGQNLRSEYRFADGNTDAMPALLAELIRLPADLLVVVQTTVGALLAKQATTTIPIVLVSVGEAVGAGIVDSLGRPGGNITGLSNLNVGLTAKRLELLEQTVGQAPRVALLWNPTNPTEALYWSATQEAAETLGVELLSVEARRPDELQSALATMLATRPAGLMVTGDPVLAAGQRVIVDFATTNRLPAIYVRREWTDAGGLMYYGASSTAQYQRAAYYIDRILKGAKPADLPVEQPREFEFVINLKTAQALGLTIPQRVLLQATEVIQ
jgi:putative ABC transport system substrate-binding protein